MIDLKLAVPKKLKLKHGVYSITNLVTGKIYIGSTSAKTGFYTRLSNHIISLRNNFHDNIHLQNAWNKYGENNFLVKIRLVCKADLCLKLEQIYMNVCLKANINKKLFRKLGYNINPIAGSSLGYKHSKKSIKKISFLAKKRYLNGFINPNKGLKISEEQKILTREKWLDIGFIKPFYVIDSNSIIIGEYDSARRAAEVLNCHHSGISGCLKNKYKTIKGLTFCYIENLQDKLKEIQSTPDYFNPDKRASISKKQLNK